MYNFTEPWTSIAKMIMVIMVMTTQATKTLSNAVKRKRLNYFIIYNFKSKHRKWDKSNKRGLL